MSPSNLKNYPKLSTWFDKRQKMSVDTYGYPEQLIYSMCQVLAAKNSYSSLIDLNLKLFKVFKDHRNPESLLEEVENNLLSLEAPFGELLYQVAILMIQNDCGAQFLESTSAIADITDTALFKFIAAFTALNTNDYERCIVLCESIDAPFADSYTLQGQALLESGRCKEAIECLKVAVQLAPSGGVAYFQLAKAYYAINDNERAFNCLLEIKKEGANTIEIAIFLALIVLDINDGDLKRIKTAWYGLKPYLEEFRQNPLVINSLFDLAILAKKRDWFDYVVQNADLQELGNNQEFILHISKILEKLGEFGWNKTIVDFLDKGWLGKPQNIAQP